MPKKKIKKKLKKTMKIKKELSLDERVKALEKIVKKYEKNIESLKSRSKVIGKNHIWMKNKLKRLHKNFQILWLRK